MAYQVAAAIFLLTLAARAEPVEIRGVWVDRSSLATREEIRTTLRNVAEAHFNTLHVNVWSRGYPLWRSQRFERETGILTDPGFPGRDVLAEVIEEAAPLGLAVVPWFEYGFVGGFSGYFPGAARRGPIFDAHPEWLARKRDGSPDYPISGGGGTFYYMAHARDDVQGFLIDLVREVVENYRVAAVEFDRARLPELDCGYDDYTRALWAQSHDGQQPPMAINDAGWLRWRAERLNDFIARLYAGVKESDWKMLVTNAPVPLPTSYTNFAQDYGDWVRQGNLDFYSPQVYRRDLASFERDLDNQIRALPNTARLVPGVDVTNSGPEELIRMIEAVRARGLPGVVVWYYRALLSTGALARLRDTVFAEKSRTPWR